KSPSSTAESSVFDAKKPRPTCIMGDGSNSDMERSPKKVFRQLERDDYTQDDPTALVAAYCSLDDAQTDLGHSLAFGRPRVADNIVFSYGSTELGAAACQASEMNVCFGHKPT